MSNYIQLVTSDSEVFYVEFELIKCSKFIYDVFPNFESSERNIKLHDINSSTMKSILSWIRHHKDDLPCCQSDNNIKIWLTDFPQWDNLFFKTNRSILTKILYAAYFLKIEKLLEFTFCALHGVIMKSSPEKVCEILRFSEDFRFVDTFMEILKHFINKYKLESTSTLM